MPAPDIDLDAYFARIQYEGPREPSADGLRALHERHVFTFPFENLDVLLERRINLDIPSLENKLVRLARGGYCYEHNTLFGNVLQQLGYSVTPLLARVRWQVPPDIPTPKTHMILRVEVDGRSWLADVGFGGICLIQPLAFGSSDAQHQDYEPRRLLQDGHRCLHQVLIDGEWRDVYRFLVEEAFPVDFDVANWFTSGHPDSRFRQALVVTRVDPQQRQLLFNRTFTIRPHGGQADSRTLASHAELIQTLDQHFGLRFPSETRFDCPGLDWS